MSRTATPGLPDEAAPAYEETLYHPTNQQPLPFMLPNNYFTVPQGSMRAHEMNNNANMHDEEAHSPTNINLTKPHIHCAECDKQLEKETDIRHRRQYYVTVGLCVLTLSTAWVCAVGIIYS